MLKRKMEIYLVKFIDTPFFFPLLFVVFNFVFLHYEWFCDVEDGPSRQYPFNSKNKQHDPLCFKLTQNLKYIVKMDVT